MEQGGGEQQLVVDLEPFEVAEGPTEPVGAVAVVQQRRRQHARGRIFSRPRQRRIRWHQTLGRDDGAPARVQVQQRAAAAENVVTWTRARSATNRRRSADSRRPPVRLVHSIVPQRSPWPSWLSRGHPVTLTAVK